MTSASSSDTSGTNLQKKIELTETQVSTFSNVLLEYGLYVMAHSSPLILDASPFLTSDKSGFAANSVTTNICVSPLPLVRAWALLSFAAVGKTKKAFGKFLQSITLNLVPEDKSIHDVLALLNIPFVGIPQCIRVFSENQPVIPLNKAICEKMEGYYSTQNSLSPICPMNFSGDDDGLASITRINKEAQKCSGGFLKYVVREENGPNRRSLMVLLSSIDCTFYWKFDGKRGPLTRCPFYESAGDGRTSDLFVWPCEGNFRCSLSDSEKLVELESNVEGFKLYLYRSSEPPTATSFEQAVDSLPKSKTFQKICVPHFSVMCPLRLSECTNNKGKFGLRRIFDREKSDLSGIFYRSHSFYPYFVTLWEHYHKAKFTNNTAATYLTTEGTGQSKV
ncbi:unnamed protein product [Cylicocyclus nassatus]|uniref:Uncharacterized protein n=1 Tax=Cylicocyclus nassatus TaxID=53992 RepID=A0AA36H1Z8_CYLNA|nr:unnamed protein product [Cylicocyclus nassatus]